MVRKYLPPVQSLAWFLLLGFLLVLLYESPYIVRGEHSRVKIHDNFDHLFAVHYAMHLPSNQDSPDTYPFILGGLPKSAVSGECRAVVFLFGLLPPYWAYRVNDTIIRLVGFLGMFLLLLRIDRSANRWPAFCIAVLFSFLPTSTARGMSSAGTPLVAFACLLLLEKRPQRTGILCGLAILALFPFYSVASHIGLYLMIVLAVTWVVISIRRRSLNPWFLAGVCVLIACYLLANMQIVRASTGAHAIVWHREAWGTPIRNYTLAEEMLQLGDFVLNTQYHASACPNPVIWIAFLVYSATLFLQRTKGRRNGTADTSRSQRWVYGAFAIIIAIALASFVWFDRIIFNLQAFLRQYSKFLSFHNLRLLFFYPLLFSVMFYFIVAYFWTRSRGFRMFAIVLVFAQLCVVLLQMDLVTQRGYPSFEGYRSAALFDKAEQLVSRDRSSFYIACLGFYPAIAHLNGFRTIDGYWYAYPLAYKLRFRPIIEKELAKSNDLRAYFDYWGSRCYLMSSELGMDFYMTKEKSKPISHLQLQPDALRALNAKYIFSAVEIRNYEENGLSFLGLLQDSSAAIDLYIYEVRPASPRKLQ